MDRPLDAAVIGAGWAGLGVSYVLAKAGLSHRVLERGRIAETWLTQRWDSFYLNTSKLMAVMPGDRYEGPDPEGFYTRDEFVALLEDYAGRNCLPVATNTPVTALIRDGKAATYRLITPAGEYREIRLGGAPEQGECFQAVVPAGCWFGAETSGTYSLVGCTVAPGFDFSDFEMAERTALTARFPQHTALITRMTRS